VGVPNSLERIMVMLLVSSNSTSDEKTWFGYFDYRLLNFSTFGTLIAQLKVAKVHYFEAL